MIGNLLTFNPISDRRLQEVNLGNSNITKFIIEVDSFKDLNKLLLVCSFTKLYDRGLECYLTQGKKQKFKPPDGFTGIFILGSLAKGSEFKPRLRHLLFRIFRI